MILTRRFGAAARLLPLIGIATTLAIPLTATGLSVVDPIDLSVEPIPSNVIQLDACPPRCSASIYALLHPSVLYKPVEPDEIIFDGATSLIWGTSPGSEWLVWGRRDGPTITVWDETMWVEDVGVASPAVGVARASKYQVGLDSKIVDARPRRARGAQAGSQRGGSIEDEASDDLGNLAEAPPELLTPIERGWLSEVLERLSKSSYAVGAVTLGLMALMARLVR